MAFSEDSFVKTNLANQSYATMIDLRWLPSFWVLILAAGLAHAQQRTMAIYGDWTLSCAVALGSGTAKACGLVQVQKVEGERDPLSQITIEPANASTAPSRISIEVHANVWLPTGVKLIPSDDLPINAAFKWCTATRCHADGFLSNDDVERLSALKDQGRIVYRNALQGDVSIPMSLNGFREAITALQKQ